MTASTSPTLSALRAPGVRARVRTLLTAPSSCSAAPSRGSTRFLVGAAGVGTAYCHRRDRREMRILSTGRDGCATPITHVLILRGVGRVADDGLVHGARPGLALADGLADHRGVRAVVTCHGERPPHSSGLGCRRPPDAQCAPLQGEKRPHGAPGSTPGATGSPATLGPEARGGARRRLVLPRGGYRRATSGSGSSTFH